MKQCSPRYWSLLLVSSCAAFSSLATSLAVIPTQAFIKTVQSGSTWGFADTSPYVIKPATPSNAHAEIQAALDEAAKTGGAVFLVSGTYHLNQPLKVWGKNVSLVGLRSTPSANQYGAFPTLTYNDSFNDVDYTNRGSITGENGVHVGVLDYPAVVRVQGTKSDYTKGGNKTNVLGINIRYTGSGAGHGGLATGVAVWDVGGGMLQDITINSASSVGPYNGVMTAWTFRAINRNLNIQNVRGDFGLRAGEWPSLDGAGKYHGIQVTSSGTTAILAEMRSEGELIGAKLSGGAVGVQIKGKGPDESGPNVRSANCTLRSVLVEDTARQGILIDNFHGITLNDIVIKNPKAEGMRVEDGFFAGLRVSNLRIENAGLSAIRVKKGMNIIMTNTELLNSGRFKPGSGSELPIAGISIDRPVTDLAVTGARIGTSGTSTPNEDYGIFWADTGGTNYFHEPQVIASNINFFTNVNGSNKTNTRTSPLPTLSIQAVGGYNTLADLGAFNAMASDSWNPLPSNSDFSDSTLKAARGFNWYDLDQVRTKKWIDLTKTNVVGGTGLVSGPNLTALLNDPDFPTEGAVLYMPSRILTTSGTWTGKSYKISPNNAGLVITKPNVQILGDGPDCTVINITGTTTTDPTMPPFAPALTFSGSSAAGGGVFGLSIDQSKDLAVPSGNTLAQPYESPFVEGTAVPGGAAFFPNKTYAPTLRIEETSKIRVGGFFSAYGMSGAVQWVNSSTCELYYANSQNYVNNGRPNDTHGAYRITGTTAGKTKDIVLTLNFAGGYSNIFVQSSTFTKSGTTRVLTDRLFSWNDADSFLHDSQIPNYDTLRIEGDVQRVRIDSSTNIHGKTGVTVTSMVVASSTLVPKNIELCRFATDHVGGMALNLENVQNADLLSCWINARFIAALGPDVTGDIRFTNMAFRGSKWEGLRALGGNNIMMVNCLTGRNGNTSDVYPAPLDRPLAGIFIGGNACKNVGNRFRIIGGSSGWMFYNSNTATTNGNRQDWGVVLASTFNSSRYWAVGLNLYGNGGPYAEHPTVSLPTQQGIQRGFGIQTSGTSANWVTDASNWP